MYELTTEEDIERNIILFKKGEELDMSLRRLGSKFKKRALAIRTMPEPWKHICKECKKEFMTIRQTKYCSKDCRRKVSNRYYYKYLKNRMKNDWKYVLNVRLRDNLRDALRYYSKTKKFRKHKNSNKYIDYESIIKKLGPCPGERHHWHIDHIKPLCSFDFSNPKEIQKAFSPNNLRWLPAKENLKKGKKLSLTNSPSQRKDI